MSGIVQIVKIAVPVVKKVAVVAAPLIPEAVKIINNKIEEEKSKISLPEIISSNGHMHVDEAKRQLEELGFKVSVSEAHSNAKFKNCSEYDVVKVSPNHKRLLPETPIVLYFVTSEVIDKSRQLFEEAEQKRKEDEFKRAEQLEAAKVKINDAALHMRDGISDTVDNVKQKIGKFGKQKKSIDDYDYEVVYTENDYDVVDINNHKE